MPLNKTRQELPWLYYPEFDRVIINAHNFVSPLIGVFTSPPPTPTRNNFGGTVGYRFTAVSGFTLRAMGRFAGSVFAASHQVGIWAEGGGAALRTVTITTGSPIDGNGWRYELLSSNLVLSAGTQYRVGVTEVNGGDNWQNSLAVSGYVNAGVVGTFTAVYGAVADTYPPSIETTGNAYTFAQLYY